MKKHLNDEQYKDENIKSSNAQHLGSAPLSEFILNVLCQGSLHPVADVAYVHGGSCRTWLRPTVH